jgi:hypothetical protein
MSSKGSIGKQKIRNYKQMVESSRSSFQTDPDVDKEHEEIK